nr:uncharacterized protein LOC127305172 [Lolium perenne]
MCRRMATACSLLVVAAAFLILPLLGSCAVSTHRLSRHAPVMLLGGDAGASAWDHGGRSTVREGREVAARRLGKRTPVKKPPSPKPQGMTGMVMPLPPPPSSE